MNTNNGLYCYVTIEHTDLNLKEGYFQVLNPDELFQTGVNIRLP